MINDPNEFTPSELRPILRPSNLFSSSIPPSVVFKSTMKPGYGKSVKSSLWREYVAHFGNRVGDFWVHLMHGTAFLLYRYKCSSQDIQRIMVCYGQQFYVMRDSCKHVDKAFSMLSTPLFPFNPGTGIVEYDFPNFNTSDLTIDAWSSLTGLLCLWGMAWFRVFRMFPGGELRPQKYKALDFNESLDSAYSDLNDMELRIVSDYESWWRSNSKGFSVQWHEYLSANMNDRVGLARAAYDDPAIDRSKIIESPSVPVSRDNPLGIKNLGDWSVEDFWDEVTYLYSKVKSEDDVKSMKQILEMKGKSMGILSEGDRGTTNNFILIQQKAMNALEVLGVNKRIVHEE